MSTIRFLRTFLAVARNGSFAEAAEQVAITQAAVGAQMRALEDEFKKTLFVRSGRGIVLSEEGVALVPHVEILLKNYEEMRRPDPGTRLISGTITIGSIASAMGLLTRTVVELKKTHKKLEVKLTAKQGVDLARIVNAGELDAGIVVEQTRRHFRGMHWTRLYDEPFMVVASTLVATRRSDLSALFRTHPFLWFDRKSYTGARVRHLLNRHRFVVNDFIELNSLQEIIELVRQNAGITIIPVLRNFDWQNDPTLCTIPLPGPPLIRRIGILENEQRSHITSIVRQHLLASLRQGNGG